MEHIVIKARRTSPLQLHRLEHARKIARWDAYTVVLNVLIAGLALGVIWQLNEHFNPLGGL